jgi:hypothetical protein
MPRGFHRVQHLPLPDDLLVARHGSSYVRRLGGVFGLWALGFGLWALGLGFYDPSLIRLSSRRRRRSGVPAARAAAR